MGLLSLGGSRMGGDREGHGFPDKSHSLCRGLEVGVSKAHGAGILSNLF